ncbi:MAG: cardiolipin synthase, partial [Ramlibacter sp.]|nr:cardiolipin synthase [Ramlibacter sp.]
MNFGSLLTFHALATAVAVLLYVVTSHFLQQRRSPAAAIAWMLFILLLPYVALPSFLAFGTRKRGGPPVRRRAPSAQPGGDWALATIAALGQAAPCSYRHLAVHADGATSWAALLATIDGARQTLDVCTFIMAPDAAGNALLEALCAKARSGVRVRLLVDGLGRLMTGRPDLGRLAHAGGQWALFVPPLTSSRKGRSNLREHRKLVVADAATQDQRLWCGGRNLASQYFQDEGPGCWQDLTFDLRGDLAGQAAALFDADWRFAHGTTDTRGTDVPATAATAAPDGAHIVASGPDQADDTFYSLLVTAAYRAERRIALVTPYFLPDQALLMALGLAARRGVRVDLLLPARSNHRLSDLARGRALRTLAQAGAHVWVVPNMLHAKLVIVDDQLALAGSANLDNRSLFLNYELMVAFHDP